MEIPSWLGIIEKIGIPLGILVVFAFGLWKTSQWVGTKIILPMHERHMQFLDRLEATLKALAVGQEQLARELGTLTKLITIELKDNDAEDLKGK